MEFNLFIVPITLIDTQLMKTYVPSKHLPLFAIIFGLVSGVLYGVYYGQDLFTHGVQGLIYGASSAGIYDLAKSQVGGIDA